jgi:hypothetical protein
LPETYLPPPATSGGEQTVIINIVVKKIKLKPKAGFSQKWDSPTFNAVLSGLTDVSFRISGLKKR